jgi:hypothetical protein
VHAFTVHLSLCTCFSLLSLHAEPVWTWRNPQPNGYHWNSVWVAGDKVFLTGDAAVAVSSDGEQWQFHQTPAFTITSVAGTAGLVIATGQTRVGEAIFKWSEEKGFVQVADAPALHCTIAFGNGHFVLAGYGSMYSSRDGLQWQQVRAFPSFPSLRLTFGGGKFLALVDGRLNISTDGFAWQDTGFDATQVASYGGIYGAVSGNKVFFSRDALNWDSHEFPTIIWPRLIMGPGAVMLGYSASYFSPDFKGWSTLHDHLSEEISGAAFFKDRYLVAGKGGHLAHSFNGITWHDQVRQGSPVVYQSAASDSTIVAFIRGEALWSTNGINWHPAEGIIPDNIVQDVAYGGGKFVAVTWDGWIVHSQDGKRWSYAIPGDLYPIKLHDVCYGPDGFVALGSREILRSRTGERWERAGGFSDNFTSIAYGNGVYVLTSGPYRGGYTIISTNLANWTHVRPTRTDGEVAFGNGRFVTVSSGRIHTSTNGFDWTPGESIDARKISFSHGVFIAGGYASVDGLVWHKLPNTPVGAEPAYYLGRFFAFGEYGAILELENYAWLHMGIQKDRVSLQSLISGTRPRKWQKSSNLRDWVDVPLAAKELEINREALSGAFFRIVAE